MIKTVFITILSSILLLGFFEKAYGKDYARLLVKGLIKLEYPLDSMDVIALDKISMRFDTKNRFDVLKMILRDRDKIHNSKKGEYYEKVEIICNALRLLDELDLPQTNEVVGELISEQGWEKREMILLSYMAAKRDIDYGANKKYLIESLLKQGQEEELNGDISSAIMSVCDNISFLSDLYIYKGDKEILIALINYSARAYGYPAEHLSRIFTEIFIQRPQLFIDVLSEKNVKNAEMVIDSLVFGIWDGNVRGEVDESLKTKLSNKEYAHNWVVSLLRDRLDNNSKNAKSR